MPPAVDTPEEVAVILGGVVVIIGAALGGAVSFVVGLVMLWRKKVKPILTSTQVAASTAADQLTPNHGSSIRDAVSRIETTVDRLDRSMDSRFSGVHRDIQLDREETGRRLEHLERFHSAPTAASPIQETTQP